MQSKEPTGVGAVAVFAVLHLLCCGTPILLLSLGFVWPAWQVIGTVLAVSGIVGFAWYLKRGCATCPGNEGPMQPAGETPCIRK